MTLENAEDPVRENPDGCEQPPDLSEQEGRSRKGVNWIGFPIQGSSRGLPLEPVPMRRDLAHTMTARGSEKPQTQG